MPPNRERQWPWVIAGYAVLFALLAAATSFLYDAVAPLNRPIVIRLAMVTVVGILLVHIWRHFRGDPRWDPTSSFEDALAHEAATAKLDPAFVKLRQELANARQSRSYFDKILWPRLCTLTQSHGHAELPMPQEPSWLRHGPSFRAIAGWIDRIAGPGAENR
jgi:hypothetical protein